MTESMKEDYVNTLFMIGKLHKFFLASVNKEIVGIHDINSTQYVLLYKIGMYKNPITIKELKQDLDYGDENLSYNLKAMEKNGYISSTKYVRLDRRNRVLSLTEKGKNLFKEINNTFNSNLQFLIKEKNWTQGRLDLFLDELCDMEEFWLKKDLMNMISRKNK